MKKITEIQNTHLALMQYHRWYQVYEVPFTNARIQNQKDILSDDVEIASQAGITKGKEGLQSRLMVFDGWKNAHHVQNTEVKTLPNGALSLEADILYQNIRPDNSKFSYTLHYSTILKIRENDLPLFTKINIQPTGDVKEFKFEVAYAENRAKSFMHYWLYCIETANGNSAKFKEILANNFELNLSTTALINTFEKFEEWITSIPNRIKISGHTPKNFLSKLNEDQTISVSVDFEWQGLSIDDKELTAETHHEWILENDLDERFARIKKMIVTQIKPFVAITGVISPAVCLNGKASYPFESISDYFFIFLKQQCFGARNIHLTN